jgi:hypothetical protein
MCVHVGGRDGHPVPNALRPVLVRIAAPARQQHMPLLRVKMLPLHTLLKNKEALEEAAS